MQIRLRYNIFLVKYFLTLMIGNISYIALLKSPLSAALFPPNQNIWIIPSVMMLIFALSGYFSVLMMGKRKLLPLVLFSYLRIAILACFCFIFIQWLPTEEVDLWIVSFFIIYLLNKIIFITFFFLKEKFFPYHDK